MTAPVSAEIADLLDMSAVTCRLWAEQAEGPYHRDDHPTRRDVVEDRDGVALSLGLELRGSDGGALGAATVEIWHCDALGRYSGFPPPDPTTAVTEATAPRGEYLVGQTFLRGSQPTDSHGRVEFRTIYPGWYPGRTVHIHVIARALEHVFTSQLYFPDARTAEVYQQPPYSTRPGRDTTNDTDEIFPTGGEPAVLQLVESGHGYLGAARLRLPLLVEAEPSP